MPKTSDPVVKDSHINNSGNATGISDVNVLKSVYNNAHKYNTDSSSLKALYEFFRDTIGSRGNANDEKPASGYGNNSISLGSFNDNYIYGFSIKATSETRSDLYYDNNNGSCTITPKYGKDNTIFRVEFGAEVSTGAVGQAITFPDLNGTEREQAKKDGTWKSDQGTGTRWRDYPVTISHEGSNSNTRGNDSISFTVRIGYDDEACRIIRTAQSLNDNIRISTKSYIVGTELYDESATFDSSSKPNQVIGLYGDAISDSEILLNWEPAAGASSYKVYRGSTVIANNLTQFSYTDTGLTPNTSYTYKVSAVNTNGEGTASTTVTIKTLPLTTRFYFKTREDFVEKGDNLVIGDFSYDTQTACIFKTYATQYKYKFNVRINIEDRPLTDSAIALYETVIGSYNKDNSFPGNGDPRLDDAIITYKKFKNLEQPDFISSYDLLSLDVYNASDVLVDQWKIAKRISEVTDQEILDGKNGLLFRDIASSELTGITLPSKSVVPTIASFSYYINDPNAPLNSNVDKEQTLEFVLPLNITDAEIPYQDTITFKVTQSSGDVYAIYAEGNNSKTYILNVYTSANSIDHTTQTGKVFYNIEFNPTLNKDDSRKNLIDQGWGNNRLTFNTLKLVNGTNVLKTWDIGKTFYTGSDVYGSTTSKFTINNVSDLPGTPNNSSIYYLDSNTISAGVATAIFDITVS